ncbi:efflux RND transporter permease subunit [Deinococcus sp. SL84]|uniref:efflux RND transporter permease subunit n=1 Tax=Deinococcus sp. SL84 TaxID=2994663 RepID=UPI002273BC08|nr:efflux RND transporter permease subunit [Deinococcus sp. SL84]MCY1702589.1 efflux RND transporter permease subunit [Deinococcus sp. SL84]
MSGPLSPEQETAVTLDRYGRPDPFSPPPGLLPDGTPEPSIHPAVRFSVRNVVFSLGIFAAAVLLGLIAASRLGTDLLPDFEVPVLAVSTTYPGASPEQVNREVSTRVEDAISTVAGVTDVSTTSVGSQSAVVITFAEGTDIDAAANSVSQAVSAIRGTLPDGAEAPVVQKFDPNAQPILTLSLLSAGAGPAEAARYAEDILVPRLQRVPGVADVSVSGGRERAVEVLLDPARLNTYDLSAAQVSGAIGASALDIPAGTLVQGGQEITFATRNTPGTLSDVENILVDSARGIQISDVADVRDASERVSTLSRVNGQPAVLLDIRKASGSNSPAVADAVREVVSEQAAELPQGYRLSVATDTTDVTRATVDDTLHEFFIAVAAVGVIVLLFLGRLSTVFAVILAVPISISAAPLVYAGLGFTFNIVSLLAIIVAIGIVVDDSIVVAENVQRYRDLGYDRLRAVLLGGSEVFSAVTAASFALLAVLIPLSLMPGLLGQFFSQFGLGLSAAILMSWLESLLFLTVRMAYTRDREPLGWAGVPGVLAGFPALLRSSLAGVKTGRGVLALLLAGAATWLLAEWVARQQGYQLEPWALGLLSLLAPLTLAVFRYATAALLGLLEALTGTLHRATERVVSAAARAYAASVRALLQRPWTAVLAAGLFLLSAPLALRSIGFSFVPQSDSGLMTVTVELPRGTALDTTNALTAQVEERLLSKSEVTLVQADVGSGGPLAGARTNESSLTVNLTPKEERPGVQELIETYRTELAPLAEKVPGAEIRVASVETGPAGSSDISLALAAPTQALLRERHAEVLRLLRADPGVQTVTSSLSDTRQERVFVPDPASLSGTGLTVRDVANALRTYNEGSVAGQLREGDTGVDIVVRLDPARVPTEQALLGQTIYAPALRTEVALGTLGEFRIAEAPATLSRLNKAFTATLEIDLVPGGPNAFAYGKQLTDKVAAAGLLKDNVTLGNASSFGSAGLTEDLVFYGPVLIVMASLLTYLVLGSQFNSFRYPLYLLLPVPLALVGGLWSLRLFGTDLDVITMIGMVILLGLSTKNSILYLEFVTERLRSQPLREALIEAAELRFRPIIMTTLTVLVISIPLILGQGDGAEFRRGLGIVILGGIVTSTLLTFYVVPSVFYLGERGRQPGLPAGQEPAPARI